MQSRSQPLPVVLDTNVVLDWHLFRDPATHALSRALEQGRLCWHVTAEMLDELAAVLARSLPAAWELRRKEVLASTASVLATQAALTPTPQTADRTLRCADPADQKFLDLALALPARWLVTRDRALLRLRQPAARRGVVIVTPAQWVEP